MKKTIISTFMISVLTMTLGLSLTMAEEVVLCISQQNNYAVLMDAQEQCIDGESEFVTSGSNIKRNEDAVPIAVFSDNKDCDVGSYGTTAQIGFDKDDDGALSEDEVLTTSSSCTSEPQEDTEETES